MKASRFLHLAAVIQQQNVLLLYGTVLRRLVQLQLLPRCCCTHGARWPSRWLLSSRKAARWVDSFCVHLLATSLLCWAEPLRGQAGTSALGMLVSSPGLTADVVHGRRTWRVWALLHSIYKFRFCTSSRGIPCQLLPGWTHITARERHRKRGHTERVVNTHVMTSICILR